MSPHLAADLALNARRLIVPGMLAKAIGCISRRGHQHRRLQ